MRCIKNFVLYCHHIYSPHMNIIAKSTTLAQQDNPFARQEEAQLQLIAAPRGLGSSGSVSAAIVSVLTLLIILGVFVVAPIIFFRRLRQRALRDHSAKKLYAWYCALISPCLLVLNLVLYAVVGFVASGFDVGGLSEAVFRIVNMLQTIFGIIYMILVPVGVVAALVIATGGEQKKA